MDRHTYLVKFLNNHNDVVYQYCIITNRIIRALDCARSWLAGNNFKINDHVVVSVDAELIDVVDEELLEAKSMMSRIARGDFVGVE